VATIVRTSMVQLLPNVQAQLMSSLGWGIERVILSTQGSDEDDETHYQAEQVIFLADAGGNPDLNTVQSMGRFWTVEVARLEVRLWTRTALDNSSSYQQGLVNPQLGHEVYVLAIQNALTLYEPSDSAGNWLAIGPIFPAGRQGPYRRQKVDKDWSKSVLFWTVKYALDIADPCR